MKKRKKDTIAIVGLGYVGLPLALEFGKVAGTIGFDVDTLRVDGLKNAIDRNKEHSPGEIRAARRLEFTSDPARLKEARFIIGAVPAPVTSNRQPDLRFVRAASETVGRNLSKGAVVVFEPTVYPGVTEDICVPILEKTSGLRYKKDFKVGYSPERINPGDREHTLTNIVKVVSGCDPETLEEIARLYGRIVKAGVFRAASIQIAEAAKVIENTQRDLNIALMNELALIFHKLGIDTHSVLEAAGTKWNFLKFRPGLVGGHCIDVDPYYLTLKAEELGYHPEVILSGRRVNANMGKYVAEQTVKLLIRANHAGKHSRITILGITLKENVSDIRNSRVIDTINELKEYGANVSVVDPHADPEEVRHEYGITLESFNGGPADAIVIAVAHERFKKELSPEGLKRYPVIVDVKGLYHPDQFKGSNSLYWRL